MFFPWKKNSKKEEIFFNKNNDNLIEELKEKGIDKNILNAIKMVPRKLFTKEIFIHSAYENIPLPIDCEQTMSQPYVVAYMIDCLKLKKTDMVLEIGTGTGYQTAIIAYLCQKIYTIEIFNELFNQAKINIDKLKVRNVDITVISQRISISEKRENLEGSISKQLNIEDSKVNIKGKTADFLGLIGDKKASASLVTILLENA